MTSLKPGSDGDIIALIARGMNNHGARIQRMLLDHLDISKHVIPAAG
jgi:hypothetical protein